MEVIDFSRIFTTALSNSVKVTQMVHNVNTICRVLLVYLLSWNHY